ncbi:TPA: hypothetical protein JD367_04030 [Citrobacter freundii]|nr:hypothetical protein [Citrobacter freundii]
MNKIIIFTIVSIISFGWFFTHYTTEPRTNLPTYAPFIIKSNLPSTCSVSTMTTSTDTKQNIPVVA